MVIRLIAAFSLLPIFLIIMIFLPPICGVVLFALMAAVASYELLWGTGYINQPRLIVYSVAMALMIVLWSYFDLPIVWLILAIFIYIVLLFAEIMVSGLELPFEKVAICFYGGILIPFMFSSLVRLLDMDNGKFVVLIPFLLSFVSDSGAYFAGVFLGKHKLAPKISPKKTIEGVVGGVLATILGAIIFCLVLKFFFGFTFSYVAACVYGIVGSLVCVFGDLSFSVIKRQTGIKDYGRLIPGHGGILDRFDSTIFVAPVVEMLMIIWPMVVR